MFRDKHPFVELRRAIRRTGTQFRKNNDNSESIFHPEGGFVYAYDIAGVEDALDRFEQTLPGEFHEEHGSLSMEDQIVKLGQELCESHPSMDARDFARTVLAYFAIQENQKNTPWPTLELVTSSVPQQEDE